MDHLKLNIRHLRAFCEVAECHSISLASGRVHISQPAISQALSKLEAQLETALFRRRNSGMHLTVSGERFFARASAALNFLEDGCLLALKQAKGLRTKETADFVRLITTAQLRSLLALAATSNFSLAARAISISQPALHRTARDLEKVTALVLFKTATQGVELTPAAEVLARYANLAFAELNQALSEIAELLGKDRGTLVIGALPLARSFLLPNTINELLEHIPGVNVSVVDGRYDDLLHGLRYGELDMMIGALRDPLPVDDIRQEALFSDPLVVVTDVNHPLQNKENQLSLTELNSYPWIVPRIGTPTRAFFQKLFQEAGALEPKRLIETSSMALARGLVIGSERLAIMSAQQVHFEINQGLFAKLNVDTASTSRDIGLTLRANWRPTEAQALLIKLLKQSVVREFGSGEGYSKNE
jgi:LysR family transcriptional regulator, regulator for genes of the gallate degradation pathway